MRIPLPNGPAVGDSSAAEDLPSGASGVELEAVVQRLTSEARKSQFLLQVSDVLASSSEYRDCLQQFAGLTVPALADLCMIDVLVDGAIVRMATAHAEPEAAPVLAEFQASYPPDPNGQHPAAVAIRRGASAFAPEMGDDFLRRTTRDQRHFELVKQLNFTSYMCAPLAARGRALGAITLVSTSPARRYAASDLALTEELARRASIVIDNVRLFEERTRIAQALQAALLPPALPTIPSLELAAVYRAAGEGNTVGGDFYDVFEIGRGAWATVIGDVAGTGPEAAAVTGLVRHALRAAGLRHRDPVSMLQTANTMLAEAEHRSDEQFCSACCVVVRPGATTTITVASAGHCAPLLLRADGRVEDLECIGELLGISERIELRPVRARLATGDRLVLYTDGLTEARDRSGRLYAEHGLLEHLSARAGARPDHLLRDLLADVERFSEGYHRDDLAMLVIGPS
jgi:serine phosphatase RsbU (regulator of sigma subunit)